MKLKNIFKKETKKISKTNFQKLDQKQVEKVIGGTEIIEQTESSIDSDSCLGYTSGGGKAQGCMGSK
jgi:hypothetical protein